MHTARSRNQYTLLLRTLGEIGGKIGNFPSLVVEECDENGEPLTEPELDDESPEPSSPPVFEAPPIPPEYYRDLEDAVNEANLLNGKCNLDGNRLKYPASH